jgi:hypothetical protein
MVTQPGDSIASAAQNPKSPTEAQDTASSFDDGVGDKKPEPGAISLWGKVKQHLRRCWWVYLIAIVILLAILLPLL